MSNQADTTQPWRPDLKAVRAHGRRHGTVPREGQTSGGAGRIAAWFNLVKLPHTVFALPFALLGSVYASFTFPIDWQQVAWVVVAFTAARFAAMAFNRVVDAAVDRANPRTAQREIPTGRISRAQAGAAVAVAAAIFVGAAGMLNPLSFWLAWPALGWILAYSYSKRFTSWSHLWLGGALAIAPVGGYVAISGTWSTPWWHLVLIAGSIALWVAGFDIFYALQDRAFDRSKRLRSMPVLLGERGSILLAKLLHGVALGLFLMFGIATDFGALFLVGWAIAAIVIAWEHQLVKPGDLTRINAAFFTANGVVSIVFLGFAILDRVLL